MKVKQISWTKNLTIAVMVASFVFLVVPLQTFLGSRDIFDFTTTALLVDCAKHLTLWSVMLFAFFCGIEFFIGCSAAAIGVGLLVCFYLETGLLSIGLPAINGVSGFCNLIRAALDGMVWLTVFVLCIAFRGFLFENCYLFLAGLAVMSVASVFDAGSSSKVGTVAPLSDGFHPCYDILKSVEYSKKRNVLVYILDMTPAKIATLVMEENPELKTYFPGFRAYRNNLCMHEETALGVPGLMTGVYFGPGMDRSDYGMSIFGTNSFLYAYSKDDIATYYSGALHRFGYTNRCRKDCSAENTTPSADCGALAQHSSSIPYLRLMDAVKIRTAPFVLKQRNLSYGLRLANSMRPMTPNAISDKLAFEQLSEASLSDEKMTLVVVHTDALHMPIRYDRTGKLLKQPLTIPNGHTAYDLDAYQKAMCEQGVYIFTLLGRHFESLRTKGVYDKSTIIVMADHGCAVMKGGENNGAESSVLWIKPRGETHGFSLSDAATTNARVPELVKRLKLKDCDFDEIEKSLIQNERIFRAGWHGATLHAFGGTLHYTDWVYGDDGSLLRIDKY